MDRTADPCNDFYQYVCGGWVKNNPIPADQASWSVYGKLGDENSRFLWGILEDAGKPAADRTAAQQKIGDYFESCMDEPHNRTARRHAAQAAARQHRRAQEQAATGGIPGQGAPA